MFTSPVEIPLAKARVLVTGGGGLIGGALCRLLLAREAQVLGTWRERPVPQGVAPLWVDLRAPGQAAALLRQHEPSLVFHLAATPDPRRDPALLPAQRVISLSLGLELAEACEAIGAHLIACGSCEEYGDSPGPLGEDTPCRPVTPYGQAKLEATQALLARAERGLKLTLARPFLTYGAGQRGMGLVPNALAAALARRPFPMTHGAQLREFNHADDIAEGLIACATPRAQGRVINLGGAEVQPIVQAARRIFAACGADPELVQPGAQPERPNEVQAVVGDHRLARELLGWSPHIGLEEGIRRSIPKAA